MYSIVKDNLEIGIVEHPTYIRMQDNGTYGLCEESEAQGIAYEGVPYHVWGMPEMEGVESVALVEFNGGTRMLEQQRIINALLGNIVEDEGEVMEDAQET